MHGAQYRKYFQCSKEPGLLITVGKCFLELPVYREIELGADVQRLSESDMRACADIVAMLVPAKIGPKGFIGKCPQDV